MTITERLKDYIQAIGGTPTGTTVTELLEELTMIVNPLAKLTVDFDIDDETDLLGKTASDLQEGMYLKDRSIYGTSKYTTGYTGFGGEDEQEGNYIALHISVPNETGVTIKVKKDVPNAEEKTLDEDGLLVIRIKDTHYRWIFTAEKSGENSFSKTFDIVNVITKQPIT